ncbi:MAG: Ig-like domain-containing protein [Bacteroidetes bacterium]|jgi:hypothetical protein|nr:Ig-like domain-containing protein [Bacteroidota bacterium]
MRSWSDLIRLVAGAVCTLWLTGCANQIPPAGGPMDAEGPQIVATWPAPFTVNFDGERVEFSFDEYVDQRSFEESVFISPAVDEYEFSWSGRVVELVFLEPLRDSTTYVITVGTDVVDLEPSRRNRLRDAFTMAISTGPTIDRGLLAGRVYQRTPSDEISGVTVLAYHLGGVRPDTLSPLTTLPTYATQTGGDGTWRLPHVRLGTYRLLAIRDEFRNLLYDREIDEYAVPVADIRLTSSDTARTDMVMHLGREDTTGPRLVNVEPKDRNHLELTFSEEVDSSADRTLQVSITDTLDGRSVPVFVVVPGLGDFKKATILCDYLTTDRTYVVRAVRVFDLRGNPGIAGAVARIFTGPAALDTLAPQIVSVTPRDSTRDLDPQLSIDLTFSQPILTETASALSASFAGPGGVVVPAAVSWPLPTLARVMPPEPLDREQWYVVSIAVKGLRDWKTARLADTVVTLRFATRDPENDGSIEGMVVDESDSDTSGPVIVLAREVKIRQPKIVTSIASQTGAFRLEGLSAGRFLVHAFRDRNANARLDPGRPYPLEPSERRSLTSDTLRVRPRWPLEGLRIRIPR